MPRPPKLTDADVDAIRDLFDDPGPDRPTYEAVAARYGVHRNTIRYIATYRRRLGLPAERGPRRPAQHRKLTAAQAKAIRLAFFEPGERSRVHAIAKRFGLHPRTVWKWLHTRHPDE